MNIGLPYHFSLLSKTLAIFLILALSACAVGPRPQQSKTSELRYRSIYPDAAAKALFDYSRFRLLAAENRWEEAISALEDALKHDPDSVHLRLNLAKALLHKNAAERSTDILENLVVEYPEHSEAHELLGDLLSYQNQYQQAIAHYRSASRLEPDRDLLQMRLAMALGRAGENNEAIAVLEGLIQKNPEAKVARLSLARFYEEIGADEKAQSVYRELLDIYPDHQQGILELGQLLEEQELIAEALALYRQGIRRNPRAAALRQQLALIYLRQNRLPEALEQLQAVRQQFPDNPRLLGRISLIQLEQEQWSAAEEGFRTLLQLEPDEDRHRYYLGMALIGQGKNAEAMKVMAPIRESSEIFSEAVLQLAYLYKQAGQLDQAVASLRKVVSLGGERPEIYYYLAAFLSDQEKLDESVQTIKAGLEKFPEDANLLYQLGIAYEKLGDRQRAVEAMEEVLRVDPAHPDALNFIAYHQAEKGDQLELALSRAQKALAAKNSGYIIDTLGWIYFKLGRFEESREQLEEASSLHPDDPVILEHLGDLYRALKLWDKAAETYRKVLQLDPQAAGVEEKLQELPLEKME